MDKRTALLYAKLKPFKALVNRTSGFIRWALEQVKNPYVACSFGKDSAVMLHLVLQHKPDIPVRFSEQIVTQYLDDYEAVIKWWKINFNINLQRVYVLRKEIKSEAEKAVSEEQFSQRKSLDKGNWDSFFVGIRAEESVGRRINLKKNGIFAKQKNGRIKISPLAWWKTEDIIAYTYLNHLPILSRYNKFGFNDRTTAGLPPKWVYNVLEDTLLKLRNTDPSAYNNLLLTFEDLKYYV